MQFANNRLWPLDRRPGWEIALTFFDVCDALVENVNRRLPCKRAIDDACRPSYWSGFNPLRRASPPNH